MDSSVEEIEEDDENQRDRADSSEKSERKDSREAEGDSFPDSDIQNKFVEKDKQSKWDSTKKIKKYINDDEDKKKEKIEEQSKTIDEKKKFVVKSPDKRFGKFDEEIGFGMFKRVYRGFDFNEGREVAWNSINVSEMNDSELNRIKEEVNIMRKLNHPNIINYISGWFDVQKKEVVIITEIICGGSLKKHLNKIHIPRLKVVKNWVKEILKGLKYLHTEVYPPIVHRDIKCDNIYIDSTNGSIKIGDLGLSKIQTESHTKSYAGTEEFMAPEVFQGSYTVLADIYSLGMCILEMVTMEKPYKECESNILKIYESSKNGILPQSIDKIRNTNLKNFIISCLQAECERPSSTQLLENSFLKDIESEENNKPVDIDKDPNEEEPERLNLFRNMEKIDSGKNVNIFSLFKSKKEDEKKFHPVKAPSMQLKPSPTTINTTFYKNNSTKNSKENLVMGKSNGLSLLQQGSYKSVYPTFTNNTNLINLSNDYPNTTGSTLQLTKVNSGVIPDSLYTEVANSKVGSASKNPHRTSINNGTSQVNFLNNQNKLPQNQINNSTIIHKVSFKNSLNQNTSKLNFSKFEINISETKTNSASSNSGNGNGNKTATPIFSTNPNIKKEEQEIQIVFIVHKAEWPNGKKIIFNYNLQNDTLEYVVKELQKAIGLTESEFAIIIVKLSEFFSTKIKNPVIEHTKIEGKNSLEGGGSTTPDVDVYTRQKKNYDNFFTSYNKLMRKIENLIINNEDIQKLEEIKKNYLSIYNHQKSNEFDAVLNEFNRKKGALGRILRLNEELNKKI